MESRPCFPDTRPVPYKSQWLYYVGVVFTLFNVSLFVTNCGLVALRFALSPPGSFTHSFTDQMECLFIPSIVGLSVVCYQPAPAHRHRSYRKLKGTPERICPEF